MSKIFITEQDTIKTELYVDYSGERPLAVIRPDRNLLIASGAFEGRSEDEINKFFEEAEKAFQERIQKPEVKLEWMLWRYWDYRTRMKLEKLAAVQNPVTRTSEIDPNLLNELKIKYLLLDWSFTDEDGNKTPLKREGDQLTKESFELVMKMEPNLLLSFLAELNSRLYMLRTEIKKNQDRAGESREGG